MDHLTFFKDVKSRILPCYTFVGTEEFVKERALEDLKANALNGALEDLNLQIMGEDAQVSDVYEAVSTLPFMAKRRVVIWNNPKVFTKEMNEQALELLKETLITLHDGVCLVVYIKGAADKRRKFYKLLKDNSCIVEFNPLSDFDAARWVGSYFKKHHKEIDLPTAEEIVGLVGTSVMELNNEVEKIYVSMGERVRVQKQDLQLLTGNNIAYGVFEMISCFLKGDDKEGMTRMYRLLKRGDSGFMMLGAIASKLRSYYQAKTMLVSGMNKATVIEKLGGGFGAKKAVEECERLDISKLEAGIEALEYVDYAIKNGLMSEAAGVEFAVATAFIK